jgi:hypothetical protein
MRAPRSTSKSEPYDLATDKGKRELGKDVAGRHDFDASGDPGKAAFDALWRLFTAFRRPREKVPFSEDAKVSSEKLLEFLRTHR